MTQIIVWQRVTGRFASEPARRIHKRQRGPSLPDRVRQPKSLCRWSRSSDLRSTGISARFGGYLLCGIDCSLLDNLPVPRGLARLATRRDVSAGRGRAEAVFKPLRKAGRCWPKVTRPRHGASPVAPFLAVAVPHVVAAGRRQFAAARHQTPISRRGTGRRAIRGGCPMSCKCRLAATARLRRGRTGRQATNR